MTNHSNNNINRLRPQNINLRKLTICGIFYTLYTQISRNFQKYYLDHQKCLLKNKINENQVTQFAAQKLAKILVSHSFRRAVKLLHSQSIQKKEILISYQTII